MFWEASPLYPLSGEWWNSKETLLQCLKVLTVVEYHEKQPKQRISILMFNFLPVSSIFMNNIDFHWEANDNLAIRLDKATSFMYSDDGKTWLYVSHVLCHRIQCQYKSWRCKITMLRADKDLTYLTFSPRQELMTMWIMDINREERGLVFLDAMCSLCMSLH